MTTGFMRSISKLRYILQTALGQEWTLTKRASIFVSSLFSSKLSADIRAGSVQRTKYPHLTPLHFSQPIFPSGEYAGSVHKMTILLHWTALMIAGFRVIKLLP